MKRSQSMAEEVTLINEAFGYKSFTKPPQFWLPTGSKRLNSVMGSRKLGLAYGKLVVIAGPPSSGKTVIAAKISAIAQKDGARIGWDDEENSFDPEWVSLHGLDPGDIMRDGNDNVIGCSNIDLFYPEYGEFSRKLKENKKDKSKIKKLLDERVETAEERFTRIESWLKLRRKKDPNGKICFVVDSATAISPEEEI